MAYTASSGSGTSSQGADRRQGGADGGVGSYAHVIGRHQAAGAVLVIGEEGLDVGGLLGLHPRDDLLGDVVLQILQGVGGGAGVISSRMSAARSWSIPSSRSARRASLTSSRASAAVSSSSAATISALSR